MKPIAAMTGAVDRPAFGRIRDIQRTFGISKTEALRWLAKGVFSYTRRGPKIVLIPWDEIDRVAAEMRAECSPVARTA
jgi:hypothetical protein